MARPSHLKAAAMNQRFVASSVLVSVTVALALSACGRKDAGDQTAGQKLDSAIATTQQKADEAKAVAKEQISEIKSDAKDATAKLDAKSRDAGITVGVNAALTRDSALSAMRINVDTSDGRVTLTGPAPDQAARDRATSLAQSVSGVTSVDNRLDIRK